MKYPTEVSCDLLRQLREAVRPAGLFRVQGDPIPHLAALIEAREPGVLRVLIGITVEADPKWQPGCVSTVSVIAEPLLPDRLPEWDEWIRRSWSALGQGDDPWEKNKVPGSFSPYSHSSDP